MTHGTDQSVRVRVGASEEIFEDDGEDEIRVIRLLGGVASYFRDAKSDGERKSLTDDAVESTTRDDVWERRAPVCRAREVSVFARLRGEAGSAREPVPSSPPLSPRVRDEAEKCDGAEKKHPRHARHTPGAVAGSVPARPKVPSRVLTVRHDGRGPRSVSLVHEETSERVEEIGIVGVRVPRRVQPIRGSGGRVVDRSAAPSIAIDALEIGARRVERRSPTQRMDAKSIDHVPRDVNRNAAFERRAQRENILHAANPSSSRRRGHRSDSSLAVRVDDRRTRCCFDRGRDVDIDAALARR